MQYLSPGNNKTGDTASFDLPAKVTCPGMTELCGSKCYAYNIQTAYPAVNRKYARNYAFSQSARFVAGILTELPTKGTVRIHVSGDFYSVEYVHKWIRIAKQRPQCEFYFYTRSWRIREIWQVLREFASMSNVTCNISCDKDTGKPKPTCASYRWCYLSTDDSAPGWLRPKDLVFRHGAGGAGHQRRRENAKKKGQDPDIVAPLIHHLGRNKVPVCPLERGAKLSLKCSRCRICIEPLTLETSEV